MRGDWGEERERALKTGEKEGEVGEEGEGRGEGERGDGIEECMGEKLFKESERGEAERVRGGETEFETISIVRACSLSLSSLLSFSLFSTSIFSESDREE
jgi:hypothetical protein